MSELINKSDHRPISWQLLATVSALALMGSISTARDAKADGDADHPTLWIELGGQFERQTGQGDAFSPLFAADSSSSPDFQGGTLTHLEKPPLFSNGAEAKFIFEPSGTDWVFSAAVRYGRSTGQKTFLRTHHLSQVFHTTRRVGHRHYSAFGSPYYTHTVGHFTKTLSGIRAAGGQAAQSQTHSIVDFTAGKDVGLGMFGSGSTSSFNVGLRFAQFASRASGAINAQDPIFIQTYKPPFYHSHFPSYPWHAAGIGKHSYHATFQSQRNFHGIGPSVSWSASLPVLGEPQAGALNVDWGANAAVLFGRQRANGSHQTSATYQVSSAPNKHATQHTSAGDFNRSRRVTVPNVGGFAGMSFHFPNAAISLGYRGDFFFGAMDAGNDTRHTKTVGLYGPFATISIGLP